MKKLQTTNYFWGLVLCCMIWPNAFLHAQASSDTQADSLSTIRLVAVDTLSLKYYQRRQELVEAALAALDSIRISDTLQFKISSAFNLDVGIPDSIRFQDDMRRSDQIGEQIKREQSGTDAVLDFGRALRAAGALLKGKKPKELPRVQDLPLPSPLEMDVLNALWIDGASTGPELFAQLDSSALVQMTAEMFWKVLRNMAERGFVSEEIVSPQLTMGFAVGPMVVPVEMSSKNLKNRVYEYQPLVGAEDMFSYVLAQNYLARQGEGSAGSQAALTKTLLRKILTSRLEQDGLKGERP